MSGIEPVFLQVDGTHLVTSEVTPGFFGKGRTQDEAQRSYLEALRQTGSVPMPMLETLRPAHEEATAVSNDRIRTLYMGFPADLNFGDRWMYRLLEARLPMLSFLHARGLSDLWKRALPKGHFELGFLGGGTLINQNPLFYQEVQNCLLAALPCVCFGTGVGVESRWGNHLTPWVELLQQFRFVGVRGPDSFERLAKAGLRGHHLVGDACLLDEPRFSPRTQRTCPEIWVDLSYGADEAAEGTAFRFRLLRRLSALEREGKASIHFYTTWEIYSPWVNCQIAMMFDKPHPLLVLDERNYRELAAADLCIAYRLHAAAAALMAGTVTWVVNYEAKCKDFFDFLKLGSWVVEPNANGAAELERLLVGDLLSYARQMAPSTQRAVLEGKKVTEENFGLFCRLLETLPGVT